MSLSPVFSTSNEVSGSLLDKICKSSGNQEGPTLSADITNFSAAFLLDPTNVPVMSYLLHKNLTVQISPSILGLAKTEVTFFKGGHIALCFGFQD